MFFRLWTDVARRCIANLALRPRTPLRARRTDLYSCTGFVQAAEVFEARSLISRF
jgi:hypothetical protein